LKGKPRYPMSKTIKYVYDSDLPCARRMKRSYTTKDHEGLSSAGM
jgi:hypothetical protein